MRRERCVQVNVGSACFPYFTTESWLSSSSATISSLGSLSYIFFVVYYIVLVFFFLVLCFVLVWYWFCFFFFRVGSNRFGWVFFSAFLIKKFLVWIEFVCFGFGLIVFCFWFGLNWVVLFWVFGFFGCVSVILLLLFIFPFLLSMCEKIKPTMVLLFMFPSSCSIW